MARNRNSFDLVGDGDDVDVVLETERTFGIAITDDESERIMTFGDLLDLVERKVAAPADGACLLRHAFREARDRLPDLPRPSSRLDSLGDETRQKIARLFEPERNAMPWGGYLLMAVLAGMVCWAFGGIGYSIAGFWGAVAGLAVLVALVVGPAIQGFLTRQPPQTVGETIRRNFHAVYPGLRLRHGPGLPSDRRQALESICRDLSGHTGPVTRDTTFLSHVFPAGT